MDKYDETLLSYPELPNGLYSDLYLTINKPCSPSELSHALFTQTSLRIFPRMYSCFLMISLLESLTLIVSYE